MQRECMEKRLTGTMSGEQGRGPDHMVSASHDKQIGFMCKGKVEMAE